MPRQTLKKLVSVGSDLPTVVAGVKARIKAKKRTKRERKRSETSE
jgi:hypothetical protein